MRSVIAILCLVAGTAFAQTGERARSTNLRQPFLNRAYLGVGVVQLSDERVKALKLPSDRGVEVTLVVPNSPAAKAGLKPNDVILELNGKPADSAEQFPALIADAGPGAKVSMTLWRNGAKQTLTATLEAPPDLFLPLPALVIPPQPPNAMPPFHGIPSDSPLVGFIGEELSPQLAEFFGVKQGVLVESVDPNTPASRAGLKAGDVVTKVNGTPVTSPREISFLIRGKRSISFTVVRNKKEMALNVELAEVRTDRDDL
jgi:serine protease Do